MTSINSIMAYHAIPDLEDRQRKILNFIRKYPDVSRNDISRALRMDPTNVSNRIVELRNAGYIVTAGRKRDRLTKRQVYIYRAKKTDGGMRS